MSVSLTFINGRKSKDSSKPSVIELRMSYNRKTKYLSTGINVLPNQFKGGMVKHHPQAAAYNEKLIAMMARAMRVVTKMEDRGMIDLEALPRLIKAQGTDMTFWEYVEQQAKVRNVDDSTRRNYGIWLKQITKWDMFRTFTELTGANLKAFDKQLHDLGYKPATIKNYHKFLKIFCSEAELDGYIDKSPYKVTRLKIETPKGRLDKYLTKDEVFALETTILDAKLARVRDVFIFCCYTGLAYSDLCAFDKSKVKSYKGTKVLEGKRVKDDVDYIIPLLPQAIAILDRYNWNLPIICNQRFNDWIKCACVCAGINKPVSTHWARHTSAMLMLNNKVPIEIVSKVLGHANITTTQKVYAQLQPDAVVDAMADYEEELKAEK